MKLLTRVFAMLLTLALSTQAQALIELRLGYGANLANPSLADIYAGNDADLPTTTLGTAGLSTDIIVSPPLIPIGFGLRNEDLKINVGGAEFASKRTAAIINWRWIDTLLLLGPIFTYGISHSGNLSMTVANVQTANITASSSSSYSLGLEVGAKLLGLMVGAELGYLDMRWNGATDSVSSNKGDLNMSGNYTKVFLGFGF